MILNEESGAFISSVELNCNYKAKCIITEIARKWLSGHRNYQETIWTALVETLCETEMRTLAMKIIEKLRTHNINILIR